MRRRRDATEWSGALQRPTVARNRGVRRFMAWVGCALWRQPRSVYRRDQADTVALGAPCKRHITLNLRLRLGRAGGCSLQCGEMSEDMGIRERVTRHGEEAIGKLA